MTKKTYRPRAKLEVFYTGGPIQLAPDGQSFACACLQETKIVDVENGSVTRTFPGDGELVTALCFTPDGSSLYAASRSLLVKKWCVISGECLKTIKEHTAPVSDITVDPSGSLVAFGSADRRVTVYDVRGGFRTHTFKGHKSLVTRVRFHPTEGELVSCSQDNSIKIWDLHHSKLKATLTGHNSGVTSVTYSEDGRYLISAGRDNTVIVWSARNNTKCVEFPVFEAIEDVSCLPGALSEQLPQTQKKSRHPCLIVACGEALDDTVVSVKFCVGGERGQVRMWRTDTGVDIYNRGSGSMEEPRQEIASLQKFPDQRRLLIAKSNCSIEILTLQEEVCKGSVMWKDSRVLMGNMDEITDVTFLDCDASRIAVSSNAASLHIFEAQNLNCVGLLSGHSDAVLCLTSFSFQSRTIVISGAKDQSIRVWDTASGTCLADATGHAAAVTALAASKRNGKLIVTVSSDKLLKVWKLKMQVSEDKVAVEKLKVMSGIVAHSKDINCVDIAPNDTLAATGSMDKSIKLFTLPNLTHQSTLMGHKRGVWSVQFSSFEKTLLSSSADTTIKMWSLNDSACLRTFEGSSASILRALYLSQSQQVMSCGGDGLVKLWNVSTCECVSTFDEHEDRIWSIAFAGEHQEVMVSGGSDSTLILWEDTTERDRDTEQQQRQEEITNEQNLSNAIQLRDFRSAAKLAFSLNHPRKLLNLLKQNLPKDDHIHMFSAIADLLVKDAALQQCLEYVRDWNTNARHCEEAQMLLKMILERHTPQRLAKIPGVAGLLEAIEAYTVRHFSRLQKLHQAAFVVDYVLDVMQVLTPEDASEPMEIDTEEREGEA